jgi:photosystem II stability/assembly factor-like uncharacterized protein
MLNGISKSTNNGSTWTKCADDDDLGYSCLDVSSSGSNIYGATLTGLSFSRDGGSSWTTSDTTGGIGGNGITDIACVESQILMTTNYGTAISSDEGRTWTNTGIIREDLLGFSLSSIARHGQTICLGTNHGLMVSRDNGDTWNLDTRFGNNRIKCVSLSDTVQCVGTEDGLYISTNDGNTWTIKTEANGLLNESIKDVVVTNGKIYVGSFNGGCQSQAITAFRG